MQISESSNIITSKSKIIILLLIILLPILGFYFGQNYKKNPRQLNNENIVTTTIPSPSQEYQPEVTTFISPNHQYTFSLIMPRGQTDCFYSLQSSSGQYYDIQKLVGSKTIHCTQGMGGLIGGFISWLDDSRFLLKINENTIKIIDFSNNESTDYTYDKELNFIGVDKSLQHWLFNKNISNNSNNYKILDFNKNTVIDDLVVEEVIKNNFEMFNVLYDSVNNGFLFTSRKYTDQTVEIRFDFLQLPSLDMRHLLTTEPVNFPSHGCLPGKLNSIPGEIILGSGCLTVPAKYLDKDQNIHIKL